MENITSYKYDAFISYRHLELDSLVAKKLQNLLEGYKAPKDADCQYVSQIKRLFRDETELTSNGNLSNEIKGALENSRFLIVVCSETTKESRWCMDEIEYFKSLHGGHLDNILTLLVSGNPEDVFPPQLCFETKETTDDAGNPRTVSYEVEPLAANVCAKNKFQSVKKLKKEYLRLAAAIVGCEFDTLFKRHKRRQMRFTLCLASVILVLCTIIGTVFMNQFAASEERRSRLLHSSAVSFITDTDTTDYQKALYYLSKSAAIHCPKDKYQNQTIHKTLRSALFPIESESSEGKILGSAIISKTASKNGYSPVLVSDAMEFVTAANPKNGRMLIYAGKKDGYISDKGKTVSTKTFLTSCDNGRYWVFASDTEATRNKEYTVTIYDSDSEKSYNLDFSAETNPLLNTTEDDTFYLSVDVSENYAAITCRGYLYLYTFDGENYNLAGALSYVDFLSTKDSNTGKYPLASKNNILLSDTRKMLLIEDITEIVILSLETLNPVTVIPLNGILMSDWAFSENGYNLLVSYGTAHDTSEGRIELYHYDTASRKYICTYKRQTPKAIAQVCFAENEEVILARDFTNGVYITAKNLQDRFQDFAPIFMPQKIKAITGGSDFAFAISTNDNTLHFMDVVSQKEKQFLVNPGDSGYPIQEIHPTEDGKLAVLSRKVLKITDTDGNIEKTHYFDSKEYFDYIEANRHKFQENFISYDTGFGKWNKFQFPGTKALEKDISNKFIKYCTDKKIPINQDVSSASSPMRLSEDGERVYIMSSSQPCLSSFIIKDENTAEMEHAITFSSEIPKDLFDPLNGKQLALTTTSGKVLVFSLPLSDETPKTITVSTPGEIREVRIDETGKFMALSIKTGNFDVLELWDIENMSLIDIKNDGKTSASGLCFYKNKLYYGFGEYVNCMNITGGSYSTADYKALLKLSGIVPDKNDTLNYSVPEKSAIEGMLNTWDLEISSNLKPGTSDKPTIADKISELFGKISEKSTEEKLKALKENKKSVLELFTDISEIQPLSEYYCSLINLSKRTNDSESAKAFTKEYCDKVLTSVCKPIHEWSIKEHNSVKIQLYYCILNAYSVIPEEAGLFAELLKNISDYTSDSVLSAEKIYDSFGILSVTKNALSTIANEGMYLSYVTGGDIAGLEKDLTDYGLITITNNDTPDTQFAKKQWMIRLAMLRGDAASAVSLEREIYEYSPEYYDTIMFNDWRYFKLFAKSGIIPETALYEYYSGLAGINGTRDKLLQ